MIQQGEPKLNLLYLIAVAVSSKVLCGKEIPHTTAETAGDPEFDQDNFYCFTVRRTYFKDQRTPQNAQVSIIKEKSDVLSLI